MNATAIKILFDMGVELAEVIGKYREAAKAEGLELQALLAEARGENAIDIYEKLGIARPTPEDPVIPSPVKTFPYGVELQSHPLTTDEAYLLQPTDVFYKRKDKSVGWIATTSDGLPPDTDVWEVTP